MREPPRGEEDFVWGGRIQSFQPRSSSGSIAWPGAAGRCRTGPGPMAAAASRRPRPSAARRDGEARLPQPALLVRHFDAGPALLKYGTEAQNRSTCRKIARGEIRWCQGYSEPGAGSDLASLATSAEDEGDHFLVNGQKIWTSYADKADWIFCLVRTDTHAKKQGGISFLLFDMATPGVSTKPILLISGYSPFCETFFDNVMVPKANLVGELNKGWDVAKYLLGHEREMISGMGLGVGGGPARQTALASIGATPDGRLDDPVLRARSRCSRSARRRSARCRSASSTSSRRARRIPRSPR